MLECLPVNVLMENCVRTSQNISDCWATKNELEITQPIWICFFVTSEFSKRSVYFSGAKLYNELPVQIWQLDSFEKFRNSANTILDWDRRHWIIAFLILYNINLKALRRGKMLSILILFYFISHVFVPFKLIFYPCNKKNWIFMREYFCLCTVT